MEATLKDWISSFWKILIHPSESTFLNESQKAQGKTGSALNWLLFMTVFIYVFNYAVFNYIYPIYVIISSLILIPIDFFILAFCLDAVYRKFSRRKKMYYEEFLYLEVVIFIVSQMLILLLSLIPAVRNTNLLWVLFLYPVVLLIVAVKSLTKLRVWQATIAVILSVTLAASFLICGPLFLFSLIRAVPGVL
jgi:hypothetical protein